MACRCATWRPPLAEALGPEAALSKSTVSRVCEAIKTEFDAWKLRDLGGVELEYLFLDGSHFRMHPGAPAEPVLCAWGITAQGSPVLVGLAPGAHEGHDPWAGFLEDLVTRGLRAPLPVITDGAPGPIGAVELVFASSLRQRCLVHRAWNLLAKVPTHAQAEVKAAYWQVFDDITAEPGEAAVAQARQRAHAFADRYGKLDSLPELTCFLRFPREHWTRIRHTNLVERTFGETRRRVKVIGRLPGERSCLSLVRAVLDRASRGWRGVVMPPTAARLLQELRRDLHPPAAAPAPAAPPTTPPWAGWPDHAHTRGAPWRAWPPAAITGGRAGLRRRPAAAPPGPPAAHHRLCRGRPGPSGPAPRRRPAPPPPPAPAGLAAVRHLPVAAARLEAAIAKAVLHHLHDHELDATLKGVARVLTPGGHLLIHDGTRLSPDRARQMDRALAAAGRPPEPHSGLDPAGLQAQLAAAGLRLWPCALRAWRPSLLVARKKVEARAPH